MASPFVVSLHDVCPASIDVVEAILERLDPLVGRAVSLAVIAERSERPDRVASVRRAIARCDEALLHGTTHRRVSSPDLFSWAIGRNDEWAGLTVAQTRERVRLGLAILRDSYDLRPAGAIPPAWRGRHVTSVLAQVGLRFVVGLRWLRGVDGERIPIATRSWDPGPITPLWRACELIGHPRLHRRDAIPCVTLHPADVRHGLLDRGLRLVQMHLERGRTPTTFGGLMTHAATNV